MNENSYPWIDEVDREIFGCNTSDENLSLIRYRNMLDTHFGSMISPEMVWSKDWGVGVISCGDSEFEDELLEQLFGKVFRGIGDAMPIRNFTKNGFQKNSELEEFSPPLIGTIEFSYENFLRIRRGMIPLYSQNYFLISKDRSLCYLGVSNGYHLFAGERDVVENALEIGVREMWKNALSDHFPHDYMRVDLLRAARMYGYV
ncbi:hypothetical protein AVKW3434_23530 [Acidovorax sp. SUPP3434]|uniref:hypothetical protein n=1 Tax=Acidovorax sp. SUPP3434 TaxID=2920880 RepID=UPI0023DE6211|nr:hypothetical protein [Acidovorax sp. SUPP3434]GKT02417.1 hypothetical protein AVKW3434_23530 [Acidovorax sp. SUPP3434]